MKTMRGLFLFMLALSLSASTALGGRSDNRTIQLMAGKADTVELTAPVADVLVANPAIADVGTLRSNRLYIVGRTVGDTNVLAYDQAGNQLADITIHVRADDKNLQETLREFFPKEDIRAKTVKDNIVLSGSVSSPSVSNQVRDLAARFLADKTQTIVDLMTVQGQQQVMLKVKVMEVRRNALREMGVETDFHSAGTRGTIFNGNDVGRISNMTPFGTGSLIVGKQGWFGPLSVTLKALENNGAVNTLAEPNLTAISGETAGFLAGGEYPVPTSRDAQGNPILEFKQFGVSLNFTPTVLSRERIALHMSTEVSEKDRSNGVTLQQVQIDGLSVRRAETTVEVASGGTIMIAGLIKSDTLHALNGLPGAQDMPILGDLFKSKSFQRNETELLIIVSPYLVDSYAEAEGEKEEAAQTPMQKTLDRAYKAPKEKPGTPVTQQLLNNLKKTYGDRTALHRAGGGFGYIVD